jgi:hypothetical protein
MNRIFNFTISILITFLIYLTVFLYGLPNSNQITNLFLLTSTINLIVVLILANLIFYSTDFLNYAINKIFRNSNK